VDLVVYDDRDRRYVPLLVALGATIIAAMIMGGVAFDLGRARSGTPIGGVTGPAAGALEEPTCVSALDRADEALASAVRIERTLSEQTALMNDLLAQRITREQALTRAVPPLAAAGPDRRAFQDAFTAYQGRRAGCAE
jgi:hypothetical protein